MSARARSRQGAAGFGLIELMVGMMLGLMVTIAAIGIFLSNQQTYRSTEGLSRIQESARTAFDLMSRDLRVAGGSACTSRALTNTLSSSAWWGSLSRWGDALKGYSSSTEFSDATPAFGSGKGARVAGTAALQMFSGSDYVASVAADSGTVFTLNGSLHDFVSGDVLLVCDGNTSSVFAASSVATTSLSHPGTISYAANAAVARFNALRWYVAYNGNGSTSLYRSRLYAGALKQEEVAQGVSAMALSYLVSGASGYVDAAAVSDWSSVVAVRIALTVDSPDKVGSDGKVLQRSLVHVVGLRNRGG